MTTDVETEPGPSHWLVRSCSDEIFEKMPGDALSRGLATKTAVDGLRERRLGALRDQWNLFLVEGREMATQSAKPDGYSLIY